MHEAKSWPENALIIMPETSENGPDLKESHGFFHSQGGRSRGEEQPGGSSDGKEGMRMAEVLRMHRHCMLSTFYKRPIRLKKAYYPGSTILWNRVSPLHVNLQVANFQKYERAFTCPITLSQFTCMGYTVTHMHPLQVDVLLCTLLYSTA